MGYTASTTFKHGITTKVDVSETTDREPILDWGGHIFVYNPNLFPIWVLAGDSSVVADQTDTLVPPGGTRTMFRLEGETYLAFVCEVDNSGHFWFSAEQLR